MKKKLLIVALVSLILISVLGAFTAFASEETSTPELTIYKHNLSLSDTIYILYAVDVANAEESEVELLVWTEPQSEYTVATAQGRLSSAGTTTIDEAEYIVFEYRELAASQMTDYIYARAHVEQDGVDYYSEPDKYSILTYVYNKLGKIDPDAATDDEKLKTMLSDMLVYGASAQEYFGYKTDTLASDKFSYVTVEGGTLPDGFAEGLYKVGATATLTTPETSDKLVFDCWTNSNGDAVSASTVFELTVPTQNKTYTATYTEPYSKGLEFTLNDDGESYSVTGIGTCTDLDVIIPDIREAKPVTSIGELAFNDCTELTSVTIPDSVESIGYRSFYNCTGLTDIYFNGTKAQWKAIEKASDWNIETGKYIVHCNNGDLSGHNYEAVVTAPTCTEKGYTTYTCNCGDSYVDDVVNALGHTEVIDEAVTETCISEGKTEGKHCSACGLIIVEQKTIIDTLHSYVNGECHYCGLINEISSSGAENEYYTEPVDAIGKYYLAIPKWNDTEHANEGHYDELEWFVTSFGQKITQQIPFYIYFKGISCFGVI